MTAVENDRLRAVSMQYDAKQRQLASQQFECALRRCSPDESDGSGVLEDGVVAPPILPSNVMQVFHESLRNSLSDESSSESMLQALLRDIAAGVQAGRQIPGDRWRLVIRVREDLLKQTNLEIACTWDELSVVLRTADLDAYHRLVDALPSLNAALELRNCGHKAATVFLINLQELQ